MSYLYPDVPKRVVKSIFGPLLVVIIIVSAEIAALCCLPLVSNMGLQGWQVLLVAAPVAGVVVGVPIWWRYAMQVEELTLTRSVLVGVGASTFAHPVMWIYFGLVEFLSGKSSIGTTSNMLEGLLGLCAVGLVYMGWLTSMIGGMAGILLGYLQLLCTLEREPQVPYGAYRSRGLDDIKARSASKAREEAMFARQLFSVIAPIYDRLSYGLSLGLVHYWRWRVSRVRRLQAEEIGLDLGTGTGELALALQRTAQPQARIIGIDFAPGMLVQGRKKLQRQGAGAQVEMRLGDVEHLDMPDNSVDCCYSAFLLRNVSDLSQSLREMRRVVRPEGHIVCLEVSRPDGWLRGLFDCYFTTCVPFVSGLLGQRFQTSYLTRSVERFPDVYEVRDLMETCGWHDVHYVRLTGGVVTLYVGMKWGDRA